MQRQRDDDRWYFAYGSNLCVGQKTERTGMIRQALRCRLPDYRLQFNKRSSKNSNECFANVVPFAGDEVWGVAYLCNPAALRKMDAWEGVASGNYRREEVRLITEAGSSVTAVTYIAGVDFVCASGRPSTWYRDRIVSGARQHGLPADYIAKVIALADGAQP